VLWGPQFGESAHLRDSPLRDLSSSC